MDHTLILRMREYMPAVLNLFSAAIIMIVSFSDYFKFSIPFINEKLLGIIIVYIGIGIFIWASFYIKRAIAGMIEPTLNNLVIKGPYKYCRHPVYLGITIAFIGLAFALKSWMGILSALLIFLPIEIYRAKLEEKSLSEKFGEEWITYKNNTRFFIPIKRK